MLLINASRFFTQKSGGKISARFSEFSTEKFTMEKFLMQQGEKAEW